MKESSGSFDKLIENRQSSQRQVIEVNLTCQPQSNEVYKFHQSRLLEGTS